MDIYTVQNRSKTRHIVLNSADGDAIILEPRSTKKVEEKFVKHILVEDMSLLNITKVS